jgi:chromosomal replication initiator protein
LSLHVVTGSTAPELLDAWDRAVSVLHERFDSTFAQWFSGVQFQGIESDVLHLAARDEFVRDWVRDHFQIELVEALQHSMGVRVKVQWQVRSELENPICSPPPPASQRRESGFPPATGSSRLPSVSPAGASFHTGNAAEHSHGFASSHGASVPTTSAATPGATWSGTTQATSTQTASNGAEDGLSEADLRRPRRLRMPEARTKGWEEDPSAGRGGAAGGGFGRLSSGRPPSGRPPNGTAREPYAVQRTQREQLNAKYTFGNFVVGPSNELAHAAARAAAGGGGPRYNPLFICGATGLGKTHLMHAIAHLVLDGRRDPCVMYVSAESFLNQFIEALQHHKMEEFRYRYRIECDVLLVDDIQFLAGREQTQEEFFHTFNALHEADKPIVVSSDKYPQDLQRMPERLISRFASGLVADIQTPALETRVAIVRKKAQLEGIAIDDDVAVLLAQNVRSNVRELEGTLIRLAAKSSLVGCPINLAFAQSELAVVSPVRADVRSVEDIQRAVCGHFRLTNSDLLSKDRHKSVAFARQVAMYLCRQRLKCSFPELGRAFGNRDHTTVMSAVRRVEALRAIDPQVKAHLDAIEDKLAKSDD